MRSMIAADAGSRRLLWLSFAAWVLGSLVLAVAMWYDANLSGARGDVGAGLAGGGIAIAFGVFILSTITGSALGFAASRRAPGQRAPYVALSLNLVTLLGVVLGTALLFVFA